jgi:tRNA(Ile)-lysidine synthase
MIHKVRQTIEKHRLLRKGDRVLAAVSGGPDSVALLKILKRLSEQGYALTLAVAHLNHGLRGAESDRDEIFVRDLCAFLKVPFFSRRTDIGEMVRRDGGSLEESCRRERYAFLADVRMKEGMDRIALGHHLDDQAETVLMRLLRGSGPEGLRGMLPLRDGLYIRPLIDVTREEILAFLEREGAAFVEDSSNKGDRFLRNRIRRNLLPVLVKEYNLQLVENLGRTAEILRMEDQYLQGVVRGLLSRWTVAGQEGTLKIPLEELLSLHEALRRRVVRSILLGLSPLKNGIGFRHVDAVMKILAGNSPDAALDMPFHVRVRREPGALWFEKRTAASRTGLEDVRYGREAESEVGRYCYEVDVPGRIDIPQWGGTLDFQFEAKREAAVESNRVVFFDPDNIRFPLQVRTWIPGDRMEPLGMKGKKKKIQDIFVDRKLPRKERRSIPLLVDRESVLWIAGLLMSERVRVTDRTGRVLKIEII